MVIVLANPTYNLPNYRAMIVAGPLYNVWAACFAQLFNRMMRDKRYHYWLKFFQVPAKRTPEDVQLVGYSTEKLKRFWEQSSKVQSIILKSTFFQSMFVMSLSATSYVVLMHQRYYNRLHSAAVFWTILLVRPTGLKNSKACTICSIKLC